MEIHFRVLAAMAALLLLSATHGAGEARSDAPLPQGVKAVWDLAKAYREATPTRERICINGLWRWQPAEAKADQVPSANWGYFKVPGSWPGTTDYMQKDCQTLHAHPTWRDLKPGEVTAAWHQREITIPAGWTRRRIALYAENLNSWAAVYVDGRRAGEIRFPAGEVDLTALCRPGRKHVLSLLVLAMPLKGTMMSFSDTSQAREVAGWVQRRGLCGDVYLTGTPAGARITDVKVDTSVRNGEITAEAALQGLAPNGAYSLRARVTEKGRPVRELASKPFRAADLKDGRMAFTAKWKPPKLWDTHTPQNVYHLSLELLGGGKVLDAAHPVRFGFREFRIEGRDFYLNGSRIFLSVVPFDNAQVSAAAASYEAARESLLRLKSFGINFVYTHNYGCEPGTHLGFAEILRAADDVGMLIAFSQPHFGQYDWDAPNADQKNGYAQHAEFYVRAAQSHPSVVAYAMSHNSTGYVEGMDPAMIDGIQEPRSDWALRGAQRALRAEAIVKRLDPGRIVYHHSSGNLGSMHTQNFYPNFVPVQEMSDWFGHWATKGVKPLFLCEYGAPFTWDFAMYRGWYRGGRTFGSAVVPWELCLAEWNSQFYGDAAYRISEVEKKCLRWEAKQFRSGSLWHRWDYPHQLGSRDFDEYYPVLAMYLTENWRAFRTWGVSAISPWEHHIFWKPRAGVDKGRKELKTDWERLQRPGFSPDYLDQRYERMDMAYERADWVPTPAAQAMLRDNMPLLAYIGGKPAAFTSKDHLFTPGEAVEKQLILINNSRATVTFDCSWSLGIPQPLAGSKRVTMRTGEQERLPLRFELPANLAPGKYELSATVRYYHAEGVATAAPSSRYVSTGPTQTDSFAIQVIARPEAARTQARIALFDPKGETGKQLDGMGVRWQPVEADADLAAYDILVVGKGALSVDGPAPDLNRVREGLKVVVFEQATDVLEKRLGFRVAEYGLRQVFRRVPDHPLLAGLDTECLRDWRGEATLVPAHPKLEIGPAYQYCTPTVKWCGIDVPRIWRCGCRGSVASVLIEKPARGDFLPILDGGYSLQYSPLMECRDGQGMVLFCQMDVTGRTESDPAAETLAGNLLRYVSAWKPAPSRKALYAGDPAGRRHLERAGVALGAYEGGALAPDQVLVVGAGGGQQLAASAPAISDFLKAGGHVLAVGLDEADANAFLPAKVRMEKKEHIAAFFEPFGAGSPLVGIGPADVHNRDPRELPLVAEGATPAGNGVLATAQNGNVVFLQLAPHTVTRAEGAVPSLVVDGSDAVEGKQSGLLTLGSATEAGMQFGQQVKAGEVGKTVTFAAFVKPLGGPATVHLEVERPVSPWDRAVKGENVVVKADEWTEVHVTFKVEKPFAQGWFAYLAGGGDGDRLRVDLFRLYEGECVPWQAPAPGAQAAGAGAQIPLKNASFEDGTEPWSFTYTEQYNVRRTYRRASFTLARALANMGVAGATPLLGRFGSPVAQAEKRWLDGLYLDEPEAWDDPYRFFCW